MLAIAIALLSDIRSVQQALCKQPRYANPKQRTPNRKRKHGYLWEDVGAPFRELTKLGLLLPLFIIHTTISRTSSGNTATRYQQ